MGSFHYDDENRPIQKMVGALWNILTLITILGVLCVGVFFLMIYTNPYSAWNPLPPPTQPVVMALPSPTPTSMNFLPATWTPTATLIEEPTATETAKPSATLPATSTLFSLVTATPSPTKPQAGYPFVLKPGHPLAVTNIAHTELGCNWMGVAGTVEDIGGGPKTQLIVVLGGVLDGRPVDPTGVQYSLTGVAPQYGQAGYEFVLADFPIKSAGTLWIQLLDQSGGPLSDRIYFDTYEDCAKNLVIISFRQVR